MSSYATVCYPLAAKLFLHVSWLLKHCLFKKNVLQVACPLASFSPASTLHLDAFHMFFARCIASGSLPTGQLFSSLTASPESRLAAAAAGAAMPLSRISSDDAAWLMAGVMRSFTREVADTPLLLVPQVCFLQSKYRIESCMHGRFQHPAHHCMASALACVVPKCCCNIPSNVCCDVCQCAGAAACGGT
jgi:hypothetical protein